MINKIKNLSKIGSGNPRLRAVVVLGVVIFAVIFVWAVVKSWRGDTVESGQSSLSQVPGDVNSTPGGKLSPEYYRAVIKSNQEKERAAVMTGKSSIPTMINNDAQGGNQALASTILAVEKMAGVSAAVKNQLLSMLKNGKLTPMQLAKLVAEGKLTAAQARAILAAEGLNPALLAQAMNGSMAKIAKDGYVAKLSNAKVLPADAASILAKIAANPKSTVGDYRKALAEMVAKGIISKADANKLLNAYAALKKAERENSPNKAKLLAQYNGLVNGLKNKNKIPGALAKELQSLQGQGLNPSGYANKLKPLLYAGQIGLPTAEGLVKNYKKLYNSGNALDKLAGGAGKQTLQQRLLEQEQQQAKQAQLAQKQAEENTKLQAAEAKHTALLEKISAAMSQQQNSLVKAWTPAAQQTMTALATHKKATAKSDGKADGQSTGTKGSASAAKKAKKPIIIQGSVIYAVLDTAVNSDYPNTPVMATIVAGKLKGTTLMGKIQTTHNGERVTLDFKTMSNKHWNGVKKISAVAIDPNSSRVAIASSVNHHYLSRFGSLLAASFLQGFGQSAQQAGTSFIPTASGLEIVSQSLNPAQRVAVGLGKVGENLGNAAMQNFNRAPTVKVDAGVGIGILFTQNVA